MLARHVHGPAQGVDDPLVSYAGSATGYGDALFLYADARGSIVYRSDRNATTSAINTYDIYGIPGTTNAGRFQYTGQVWLPELGMYYYKARIYSPTLGRFLQTDPIGYEDNVNLYAYVGNDPVNGVDPTGMYECGSPDSENCQATDAAVSEIKAAKEYYSEAPTGSRIARSSKAAAQLGEVLETLGTENDGNGLKTISGAVEGANGLFEPPELRSVSEGGGRRGTITLDPRAPYQGSTLAHEARHARNYHEGYYLAGGRMLEEYSASNVGFLILNHQGIYKDWKSYIYMKMMGYTGFSGRMAEREAKKFLKLRGVEIKTYVP